MCDVLIPALIGVAALGLLGGGGGAVAGSGCDNCPTGPVCAVEQVGNKTITYPQLAGEGTNVVQVSAQHHQGYGAPQGHFQQAPQAQYQPAPQSYYYAPGPEAHMGHAGHYGAPAYQDPYQTNVGGSINYDGQSALGAGAYGNEYGAGVGANVGGLDAGVGVGGGGIGANVGDVGVGLGAQSY